MLERAPFNMPSSVETFSREEENKFNGIKSIVKTVYKSEEIKNELLRLFNEEKDGITQARNKLSGEVRIERGDQLFRVVPIRDGVSTIMVHDRDENNHFNELRFSSVSISEDDIYTSEHQGLGKIPTKIIGSAALERAEELLRPLATENPKTQLLE